MLVVVLLVIIKGACSTRRRPCRPPWNRATATLVASVNKKTGGGLCEGFREGGDQGVFTKVAEFRRKRRS